MNFSKSYHNVKPERCQVFVYLHCESLGGFALRDDLLLSTVTKVGKNTGRNLRFLHFRACYNVYVIVNAYRTITGDFLFRFVKRIVSAPAPLPLMLTPNSASVSTVEIVSGSGARGKSMRRGVKKTCQWHVFSLRSRRLCRRSIHLDFHRKT